MDAGSGGEAFTDAQITGSLVPYRVIAAFFASAFQKALVGAVRQSHGKDALVGNDFAFVVHGDDEDVSPVDQCSMRFDSLFDQVGVVCCGRTKSLYVGSGLFGHLLIAGLKLVLPLRFGLSDLPVDSPAFFAVQFSVFPAMPATAFSGSPVSEGASHAVPDAPAGQVAPFAVGGEALYHAFFSYRFRGMAHAFAHEIEE